MEKSCDCNSDNKGEEFPLKQFGNSKGNNPDSYRLSHDIHRVEI